MYKVYVILTLTLLLVPIYTFAENVDVIADPPSGTYHTPLYITLTPTQPNTKTFYSFKPDGYPQDAFLYTKPILLKYSSPFIYFSIISTSNESKIKQNNYTIEYSPDIHLADKSITGSGKVHITIINDGLEEVDIGLWYVQSESDTVTFPEHTILLPQVKHSIDLNYSGTSSIVLRSPDDDEKDILVNMYVSKVEDTPPSQRIITNGRMGSRKIISIKGNVVENPLLEHTNISTGAIIPHVGQVPNTEKMPDITTVSHTVIPRIDTPPDINQIVKVSTLESGQKNINLIYGIVLVFLSIGVGALRWFLRNK